MHSHIIFFPGFAEITRQQITPDLGKSQRKVTRYHFLRKRGGKKINVWPLGASVVCEMATDVLFFLFKDLK